jgi:hypothetical protein
MSDVKVGELLTEEAHRDAIHIAIAPVIAGEQLNAGDHIGFRKDGKVAEVKSTDLLGIVDPFLKVSVRPGDKFYMFLYPRTITSLRHEWTHPKFPDFKQLAIENEKAESRQWIEEYASSIELDYNELMSAAFDFINSGDYLNKGELLDGKCTPEEFWSHYEKITGKRGEGNFFSCSC